MPERVLSTRELNRALLARQLLLERSCLPLTRALERVAGLQTQYAPSAYVGLWSRLKDFRRDSLTKALEQKRAVQATLMRVTIHIVSAGDYPLMSKALREPRRAWWLRVQRHQVTERDMERVATLVRKHLASGPLRQTELIELIEGDGWPRLAWSGVGLWVDLVRVPPSGTWERRRADLYGLADDWVEPARPGEAEGIEHLVSRYLRGFGPASMKDIASWTGIALTTLRPVAERVATRRFRDERGGELLDVPRAPLPDPSTPAPVRFLPTWDATLLAHARRTQILPEKYRALVFHTKNPQSVCTFLVDGRVAGTWRYEGGRVRLDPFDGVPRSVRRELQQEAERLAVFHRD